MFKRGMAGGDLAGIGGGLVRVSVVSVAAMEVCLLSGGGVVLRSSGNRKDIIFTA